MDYRQVNLIGNPFGGNFRTGNDSVIGFVRKWTVPCGSATDSDDSRHGDGYGTNALHALLGGQQLTAISRKHAIDGIVLQSLRQTGRPNGRAKQEEVVRLTGTRGQRSQGRPEQHAAEGVANQDVVPSTGQLRNSRREPGSDLREIIDSHGISKAARLQASTIKLPEQRPSGEWRTPHAVDEKRPHGWWRRVSDVESGHWGMIRIGRVLQNPLPLAATAQSSSLPTPGLPPRSAFRSTSVSRVRPRRRARACPRPLRAGQSR